MKHVSSIEITSAADDGFWMQKAYRVPHGVFPAARPFPSQDKTKQSDHRHRGEHAGHRSGRGLAGSCRRVRGQGHRLGRRHGIRQVDVSTDDGKTWQTAKLDKDLGPFAFRAWRYPIARVAPGPVALRVRATANSGAVQPDQLVFNPAGYHNNAVRTVHVIAA